jgi:hypothetical protein
MSALVLRQLGALFEAFTAFSALERLDARVHAEVVFEVAALVKLTLAYAAHNNRVEALCLLVYHFFLNAGQAINLDMGV